MPPARPVETPPLREAFQQFGRLVRLIRPYWGPLLKGIGLSLIIGLLGMAVPYLSKLLIDRVYASHDVILMHVLVGGILAAGAARSIVTFIRTYFTAVTIWHLASATGLLFFNHLQHLRVRFFDEHRVGEISSRFQDVRTSLAATSRIFESLLVNGTYLLLVPPFLFLLQWKLALVAMVTIPLSFLVMMAAAPSIRRYHKRSAEAYAGLNAFQVEMLSHVRTLKAMAFEPSVFQKADRQTQDAMGLQVRGMRYMQLFVLLNGILKASGNAVLIWYAWKLILRGEMSLGDYVAFMMYREYLVTPLTQLVVSFGDFQQSSVNLGRMFEYLDTAPEQDPAAAYRAPGPLRHVVRGDVHIRGVSFDYSPERRILHDVDLEFPRGTVTAIVGPSGAGKSTLLRLVTRMEESAAGQILIDGVPVEQMPLPDLRRQVTVVWQEVGLVRGSVWENLTLGAEDPTPGRVEEAVRLCHLDGLIADMRQGYQTPVGEWGSTLSGGQRQRIALARAVIRDTPVLLLDEATSNLDMQTETEVLRKLFARYSGRTVVFVTHRLSTAALADQICVVEHGRVAGVGTHEELLRGCGAYQRLHGDSVREVQSRLQVVHP
jgi:ABC-type bacteriocin/lantibiotic exporter with double-glycine peptidase domain